MSASPVACQVQISTRLGDFTVELYPRAAPVTVANFLAYVDSGRYRGSSIFRIVHPDNQPDDGRARIQVIHGGTRPLDSNNLPMIPLEATGQTGLRHCHGAISMGRDETDSAEGDFFICVGDQPAFDQGGERHPDGLGFAAFGLVVAGMDVVERIYRCAGPEEYLAVEDEIEIIAATRREDL